MKDFFKNIKKHYPIVLTSIVIYQIALTIFFYSSSNLHILCWMIVFISLTIVVKDHKSTAKNFLKKIFTADEEKDNSKETNE